MPGSYPRRRAAQYRSHGGLLASAPDGAGRGDTFDGGTFVFNEAGELPLALHVKLLRAVELGDVQRVGSLETRHADVHVSAATSRLLEESAAGRFRADLFYRLSIIVIHLAPLRERREDIPYLTARFGWLRHPGGLCPPGGGRGRICRRHGD